MDRMDGYHRSYVLVLPIQNIVFSWISGNPYIFIFFIVFQEQNIMSEILNPLQNGPARARRCRLANLLMQGKSGAYQIAPLICISVKVSLRNIDAHFRDIRHFKLMFVNGVWSGAAFDDLLGNSLNDHTVSWGNKENVLLYQLKLLCNWSKVLICQRQLDKQTFSIITIAEPC